MSNVAVWGPEPPSLALLHIDLLILLFSSLPSAPLAHPPHPPPYLSRCVSSYLHPSTPSLSIWSAWFLRFALPSDPSVT
eukprot:1594141-Rhodomonas_salina.3